ncbi:MAG TPA: hypothetical protein VGC70_03395 [Burkholderiales bacterium]
MRILGVLLLAIAVVPCVVAPWLVIPLAAGLLSVLLAIIWEPRSRIGGNIARVLKPVLIIALLSFAVWLIGFIPKQPVLEAYEANGLNMLMAQWLRITPPVSAAAVDPVQTDRRSLIAAVGRERQKIARIRAAPDLRRAADVELVRRNTKALADEQGLGKALAELKAAFDRGAGSNAEGLLNSSQLKKQLERATAEIDKLEKAGLAAGQDAQQVREKIGAIPDALRAFDLDSLYASTVALQGALEASLGVHLEPRSTYQSSYDRSADTLTSEQWVTIPLENLSATQVDLTGLISRGDNPLDPDGRVELFLREDAQSFQSITVDKPVYRLADKTRQFVIIKRVTRRNASAPFLKDEIPLSLKEVRIDWPLPVAQAFTVTLQKPDDAAAVWPSTVAVDVAEDAALQRVVMPSDAVYYVEPLMKRAKTATADELHPENATPKIRELASGQVIRVQVMPPLLSNKYGQAYKEYIVLKNTAAAIVVWVLATLGGLLLTKPWD